MRISDWSSDVCSSDLVGDPTGPADATVEPEAVRVGAELSALAGIGAGEDDGDVVGQGRGCLQQDIEALAGGELAHGEDGRARWDVAFVGRRQRSEEHTSELQSLMRISYAVFCLKKKKKEHNTK